MRTEEEYLRLENKLLKKEIEILELKQKAKEDVFKFIPSTVPDLVPGTISPGFSPPAYSPVYNPFRTGWGDFPDSGMIGLGKVI